MIRELREGTAEVRTLIKAHVSEDVNHCSTKHPPDRVTEEMIWRVRELLKGRSQRKVREQVMEGRRSRVYLPGLKSCFPSLVGSWGPVMGTVM